MRNSKLKKERKEEIYNKSIINWIAIIILIFFIFIFFYNKPELFKSSNTETILNNSLQKLLSIYKKDKNLNIENRIISDIFAKSYVVYDVYNDKIILSKNENEILPLASLTKVITAQTALSLKSRDTLITIKSSKMRQDEKLDLGLKEDQKWKLGDLLKYGLIMSSNSSMDIIASSIYQNNIDFVNRMNDYMKSLGFSTFNFNSASGLDYQSPSGEIIGGKGSAIEYAKFFIKAYKEIGDILSYTIKNELEILTKEKQRYFIKNTNRDVNLYNGLLASKTGLTDSAGGNLAVIFNGELNRPIVIVVLGSTESKRFSDVKRLYDITKKILEQK